MLKIKLKTIRSRTSEKSHSESKPIQDLLIPVEKGHQETEVHLEEVGSQEATDRPGHQDYLALQDHQEVHQVDHQGEDHLEMAQEA